MGAGISFRFYSQVRQPVQPGWEVPVAFAKHIHAGGDKNRAHEGGVQEHGYGKPKPYLLVDDGLAAGESAENGDHYKGGSGDQAGG